VKPAPQVCEGGTGHVDRLLYRDHRIAQRLGTRSQRGAPDGRRRFGCL